MAFGINLDSVWACWKRTQHEMSPEQQAQALKNDVIAYFDTLAADLRKTLPAHLKVTRTAYNKWGHHYLTVGGSDGKAIFAQAEADLGSGLPYLISVGDREILEMSDAGPEPFQINVDGKLTEQTKARIRNEIDANLQGVIANPGLAPKLTLDMARRGRGGSFFTLTSS